MQQKFILEDEVEFLMEVKVPKVTENPVSKLQSPIEYEATMFALFAFKVLMGENEMRRDILLKLGVNVSDIYFPKKYGNCGTFTAIQTDTYSEWEQKLDNFLKKIINKSQQNNKNTIYTTITPPSEPGNPSHYLSLIINVKQRTISTFDSLLSSNNEIVMNNNEVYTEWEILKKSLKKWSNRNKYVYNYATSKKAWQNTSSDVDSWCQTWTLLFQYKLASTNVQQLCNTIYSTFDIRQQLIKLVKTKGTSNFEDNLQREYEAQIEENDGNRMMLKFNARQLITNAEYKHFFESYS